MKMGRADARVARVVSALLLKPFCSFRSINPDLCWERRYEN